MKIIIYCIILIAAAVYMTERYKKEYRQIQLKRLKKHWSVPKTKEDMLSYEQLQLLLQSYQCSKDRHYIDDITWNDLNMDRIFNRINYTESDAGREYLYRLLREPEEAADILNERNRVIDAFYKDEAARINTGLLLDGMPRSKKYSLRYQLDMLDEITPSDNIIHYMCILSVIISLAIMLGINPVVGMFLLLISAALNIISYYRYKARIEPYLFAVKTVVSMSGFCTGLYRQGISFLDNGRLKKYGDMFSQEKRKFGWIASGNGYSGSLADAVIDYIRMLTHIDIIMYNKITGGIKAKKAETKEMAEYIGYIDAMLSTAYYRSSLEGWTRPQFNSTCTKYFEVRDMYHPLIDNPVKNSFKTESNILITGSNASGKSTFLRTAAVNVILAQSIYTCTAGLIKLSFFRVMSAMSINDSLIEGDSYYMAEIKAVRRILECSKIKEKVPVLCITDELLRGTNTIERISAGAQILFTLAKNNCLCFTATHDIELTRLLCSIYENYHFEEIISGDDIKFSYIIHEGPAVTTNAILLLKMLEYDSDITQNAARMAAEFEKTGLWKI